MNGILTLLALIGLLLVDINHTLGMSDIQCIIKYIVIIFMWYYFYAKDNEQ